LDTFCFQLYEGAYLWNFEDGWLDRISAGLMMPKISPIYRYCHGSLRRRRRRRRRWWLQDPLRKRSNHGVDHVRGIQRGVTVRIRRRKHGSMVNRRIESELFKGQGETSIVQLGSKRG
jgi:hypothetical protein